MRESRVLKKLRNGEVVICFKLNLSGGEVAEIAAMSGFVDVLFDSVAQVAKSKVIGVILTGMGSDGAKGLLAMKKKGAYTIGQDEESCVVYGMPKVAFNIGAVSKELPLDKIPQEICNCFSIRMNSGS